MTFKIRALHLFSWVSTEAFTTATLIFFCLCSCCWCVSIFWTKCLSEIAHLNCQQVFLDFNAACCLRLFLQKRSSCQPNPCQNGGLCIDQGSSYVCVCPYGLAGKTCQNEWPLKRLISFIPKNYSQKLHCELRSEVSEVGKTPERADLNRRSFAQDLNWVHQLGLSYDKTTT